MEINVNSLRHMGDSGFLKGGENNELTRWGTNSGSRLVGWNKTTPDENLTLRSDFARALRGEYGKTPEGAEFVEGLIQTMTGFGSDKTPLSMVEVKFVLARLDANRLENSGAVAKREAATHTENLALCDKLAPEPPNQGTEQLAQTKEMFQAMLTKEHRDVFQKLNEQLPAKDKIGLYGGDDRFMKSLLPEIREKMIALSDGGKHKITQEEAEAIVRETFAQVLDDMSKIIGDTFRTGLTDPQTAQFALQRLQEARAESEISGDQLVMTRATTHSQNKAIADELAPDPDKQTYFSGRQLDLSREIFQDLVQDSDFSKQVKKMNDLLPDNQKIKLVGSDSFLKALLPQIRENILSRSDEGRHKITQEEAESIVRGTITHAFEQMTKDISDTFAAGAGDRTTAERALSKVIGQIGSRPPSDPPPPLPT